MRVHVDLDRCGANGMCVMAAPEVFALDDAGRLRYEAQPDEELGLDVEDAARGCPVRAITISHTPPDGGAVIP